MSNHNFRLWCYTAGTSCYAVSRLTYRVAGYVCEVQMFEKFESKGLQFFFWEREILIFSSELSFIPGTVGLATMTCCVSLNSAITVALSIKLRMLRAFHCQ